MSYSAWLVSELGMKLFLAIPLVFLLLAIAAMTHAAGRLVLSDRVVVVDQRVWVCVSGSEPPRFVHLDGNEEPTAKLATTPAGSQEGKVHLVLNWPERGPLGVLEEIDSRLRVNSLPSWGDRGHLGPGDYIFSAEGFAPETLTVRPASAEENRTRAALARAWFHCEAGDSVHAANLVEGILKLDPGSPYRQEAFLILLDILPHTQFGESPEAWLSEWVARHHSDCVVGEGIKSWFKRIAEDRAKRAVRSISAAYPRTEAARSAIEWLE